MINAQGYVWQYVGRDHPMSNHRGYAAQHRVVMAERIGRPLLVNENVHHLNGVRNDNREENLELWVRTQPQGQRAADLLVWARSIIQTYGPIDDRL